MKNSKSDLDEMQEMKLLGIEHTAYWICCYGLIVAIFAQIAMGHGNFGSIGGECVILTISSIYLLVGCLKNGIWDRKLKPNMKTNVLFSVGTGLAVGVFWFAVSYYNYRNLLGSAAAFLFMWIITTALVMLLLTAVTAVYKRKTKQLDAQADEEENEE